MVDIKVFFCIFFILFSTNCYTANSTQIIRDAEIELFLQKLINNIVQSSNKQNKKLYPRLILDSNYNAFVTGTDKVYINTGLLQQAFSIDEVQGVLAHEIGHLFLKHHNSRLIDRQNKSKYSSLAAAASIALTMAGKIDSTAATGLLIGGQDLALKSYLQFSRIQETQADSFALEMLRKSKISSIGIKQLHKRLSEEEYLNKDLQSKYYRSHPFFKSRLDQIERFESETSETFKKTDHIYIYKRKINLQYINNKITAYNKDPFNTLDKHANQSNTLSRYASTIAYLKVGKHDLGVNNLNDLLKKYKKYPFFYELLADIYYDKGDFELAILNYKIAQKMLSEDSDNSGTLIKFALAKSLLKTNETNNIKKAIIFLEEIIQVEPRWSYVWRLIAQGYGKVKKRGITFIALAEESMIKKNFIKAKKYVGLALKDDTLPISYRLRGNDILARLNNRKR